MFRLTTLGTVDLRDRHGKPIRELLSQPKRVALLVYIAIESRKGPVSRDRLLALFWPESDSARARNTLSQALHHLRQSLGVEVIAADGANAVRVQADALWCDACVVADALERGEAELATDLYRGDFCPTLFVSGAPEIEAWLEEGRTRLRRQAVAAATALAIRLGENADAAGATRAARRALALRPDDEADVRRLLSVMDAAGDATGALLAYQDYERRLVQELEATPEPRTREIADAIRRRRDPLPDAERPQTPAPASPFPGRHEVGPYTPGRYRRWHGAVAGTLVLLLGTSAAMAWRRPHAALIPPSATAVAVMPFTVRGSTTHEWLGEGMVDLVSAKLDGTDRLHAIDPRTVIAAVTADSAAPDAQATARRLGAGWYIRGEILEVAGRLQIRGSLYRNSGTRPAATATVTGDSTALFALVDDLTGQLLVGFGGGRDTSLTRLAAVTTHSLPALKAFLAGEQAMRAGRDAAAAEAFREAVTLDTTFAVAQYRLAVSATWISVRGALDNVRIAAMSAAAARNAEHLTPLVRDLLNAYNAYKLADADESERAYRRIVESHPDNVEAWFMLGEVWFHYNAFRGRTPDESRQAFMRVLTLDPTNTHALLHLARLAALEGHDRELDSLGRMYLSRYSDAERTLEIRTLVAALHDDLPERRAITREAMGSDAILVSSLIQAALLYAQDLDLTRTMASASLRLSKETGASRVVSLLLSDLELSAGRWSARPAAELMGPQLNEAWLFESRVLLATCPAVPQSRTHLLALRDSVAGRPHYRGLPRPGVSDAETAGPAMQAYLVGLLSARLGDTARLRAEAEVLDAMSGDSAALGLVHTLRAQLFLAAKDTLRAVEELQRFPFTSIFTVGHWGMAERFMMADLLAGAGRREQALEWYLSYPAGFDEPWVAPAHLRNAQLYEQIGNLERARFHYGRFIRLWSGADAELQPLVARARQAIDHLPR
jgi:DNA-binding SARP family transcriptional activator/tetratricopeptide (TPR) repeat protein